VVDSSSSQTAPSGQASEVLEKSGIDGRSRPENLAFEDFAVLAKTIEESQ
jgi:16S rRNA A1518/A1519 N6-dimethyltransferase RsmA/KsgA/DIM1 with predicted DNA glycosylase/AP lyase activity